MFGLPDRAPLSNATAQLTRAHRRRVDTGFDINIGTEPPLLFLLRDAVTADDGAEGGAGGGKPSSPADVTALLLHETILQEVNEWWPGTGVADRKDTSLVDRLEEAVSFAAGRPDAEAGLLEKCWEWTGAIRNMLEPPKKVHLRGVSCPFCDKTHVSNTNADGETTYIAALLVHPGELPPRAEVGS